jgi:hypothetical protein
MRGKGLKACAARDDRGMKRDSSALRLPGAGKRLGKTAEARPRCPATLDGSSE